MSIRIRIIIGFIFIVGVGFYFLVDRILEDLRPRYLEAVEESLVDQANVLAVLIEIEVTKQGFPIEKFRRAFANLSQRELRAQIYKMKKTKVDERIYITDRQGKVLFDSESGFDEGKDFSQWRDIHLTLQGEYGARSTRDQDNNPTTSVLHVSAPIYQEGVIVGVVTVRKPTASINFFIQSAQPKIMVAGALAALAVIILGILLSAWITQPIRKLTRYARSVRDGRRQSFPALGDNEIGEMGAAFEEMREALAGKKYIEKYVQSLTHELKSPLSAIQGAAEILESDLPEEQRRQFVRNISSETERMKAVVERLLELAALESRNELRDVEVLVLDELIRSVTSRLIPQLNKHGLKLSQNLESGLTISGERFLIEHALENLLQNAIDFSHQGGTVFIVLSRCETEIVLEVQDEGSGIPDYALGKVFERFYSLPRVEGGKKSSGLGLSFVKEVVDLHQGSVQISNCLPQGVCVRLIFPRGTK